MKIHDRLKRYTQNIDWDRKLNQSLLKSCFIIAAVQVLTALFAFFVLR